MKTRIWAPVLVLCLTVALSALEFRCASSGTGAGSNAEPGPVADHAMNEAGTPDSSSPGDNPGISGSASANGMSGATPPEMGYGSNAPNPTASTAINQPLPEISHKPGAKTSMNEDDQEQMDIPLMPGRVADGRATRPY